MISSGNTKLDAIPIVAQRDKFTLCGVCLDWILNLVDLNILLYTKQKRWGDHHFQS